MSDIVEELLNDTKTEWSLENGEPKRNKIIRPLSEKAAAEITRLRAELAVQWLPIEQAKENAGNRILVVESEIYFDDITPHKFSGIAYWHKKEKCWYSELFKKPISPPHFQPLPTPPQPESAT